MPTYIDYRDKKGFYHGVLPLRGKHWHVKVSADIYDIHFTHPCETQEDAQAHVDALAARYGWEVYDTQTFTLPKIGKE